MPKASRKPAASATPLQDLLTPRLRPANAARTKAAMADLLEAAADSGREAIADLPKETAAFLAAVMDCSPFLRGLIRDDPAAALAMLATPPVPRLRRILTATAKAWAKGDEHELSRTLRRGRHQVALLTALADLGGVWDVMRVTKALTDFADAAVGAAARFVLADAHAAGKLKLADPARPEERSGWFVLGMGKLGAGELNYSSDIDLIVLYDAEQAPLGEDVEPAVLFVRMTQKLVALLQEHTADGYVFRTDLRLRPDPGSTNVAMSTEAALQYYESHGQNWERAAFIKARAVAGDVAAGEAFLAELTPFIWRRYLDFAAIADIHSIKRQIHDHRGHATVKVAGHNIKLGRGGIREIEFFVQTQQLIAGGREPELRGRRTLDMLAMLAKDRWIDAATRDDMSAAYSQLRMVEHCLQMVDDAQTHTLPEDEEGLARIARMAGFRDRRGFERAIAKSLSTVRDRYAALFEQAPALAAAQGSLSFTGEDDHPETLETIAALGFRDPALVSRTIRGWHYGRYPATRSASARERLTDFVPVLLQALAGSENADAALGAFDGFLSKMPAGVQLFALLQNNPLFLDLLVSLLATAPRLAETIARRAHVVDAVLDPAFFGAVPDAGVLRERLKASLDEAQTYEEVLDRARIFGQEQQFLLGVRVLAGTIGVRQAGYAYSDLADTLLSAVFAATRKEFEATHGRMKGGAVAVVAMGKLGGREMTASSDVDLILLYDFDEKAGESSGRRPLQGTQYFTLLTQRLVAAVSAPTAEGKLYEVDLRLRPSGNTGPLATHIEAFAQYQAREAWTWERMALIRARVIAGDKRLAKIAEAHIQKALTTARKRDQTIADILEMRGMVEEAKGGAGAWDLKQAAGGLVDIEFIAQSLVLVHAAKHPELIATETEAVLTAASEAGLLAQREAEILLPALRLYQALTQITRLCLDRPFDPDEAPRALLQRLAQAGEVPDFARLDALVRDTEEAVRAAFERMIGKVVIKPSASGWTP